MKLQPDTDYFNQFQSETQTNQQESEEPEDMVCGIYLKSKKKESAKIDKYKKKGEDDGCKIF